MSPEQLAGDKLDGRSDIYSLALVLYRMLTGTLPFQADSAQEVMIKRLTDDPLPLDQARPDLQFPPKLQLVMNNALARTAAERYQQAAEFGRDTMDAVAGMGPPATRVDMGPQGATQMMSNEDIAAATKHQAAQKAPAGRRPTAPAAPPAPARAGKKFPVLPVVGGVGGVGALAVVAFLMMNGGTPGTAADSSASQDSTKQQLVAAPPDTGGQTSQQNRPVPTNTATNVPAPRPGPGTTPTQQTQTPAPGPQPGTIGAAVIEDSLSAAVRADQNGRPLEARRLARWVYTRDQATREQKATAAELVATTYEDDQTTACEWIRYALSHASGAQRDRLQNMSTTFQCPQ
jgi:hypothetical protein